MHLGPVQLVAHLLSVILDSIVVSIPACHAGDRGSIPRRGDNIFHLEWLQNEASVSSEPLLVCFVLQLCEIEQHFCHEKRYCVTKPLHRPGIEPGPPAWQASILPLNHRC